MDSADIARVCHEVNRAYCAAMGDTSQVPWDEAPGWQRVSAMNGVDGVLQGNSPEESHQAWCDHKLAEGWTYGPVKDILWQRRIRAWCRMTSFRRNSA